MEQILCIDDEPMILAAYQRRLRKRFTISTATSGKEGLDIIRSEPPFAVIVSDMMMPGMDGITFLRNALDLTPDSVRVMLTGVADLQTAVEAVNESSIFRFLTKPCSPENLGQTLEDGVRQYRLITAEKELLEKTLKGSINMLVETLSLTCPAAFSRSQRIKEYTTDVARDLGLTDTWELEMAAMLSMVGCVTVPADVLSKFFQDNNLTDEEARMVSSHPTVAANLLRNIPRLEKVSEIIAGTTKDKSVAHHIGVEILKAVQYFDRHIALGVTAERAIELIRSTTSISTEIIQSLAKLKVASEEAETIPTKVTELEHGMILAKDVTANNGLLVVAQGQKISSIIRKRLINFAMRDAIGSVVYVLKPKVTT